MINPNGRVVYYVPEEGERLKRHSDQPFAALIVHTWSDTRVNLTVFDHDGGAFPRVSINEEGASPRAEWMPYQLGQAAKADKLQAELDKAAGAQGSQSAA